MRDGLTFMETTLFTSKFSPVMSDGFSDNEEIVHVFALRYVDTSLDIEFASYLDEMTYTLGDRIIIIMFSLVFIILFSGDWICRKVFLKMMPTMPPDSHKISLKIIEAIKQHPVLYTTEVKGSSVKLQEFRQKVWKRISDELGLDPMWVRLRWKNLRDTYCRILKYKNKTEKGFRRKKWIFEDHLSFLKFPYESNYQPQAIELTEEYIQDINAGGISSEGLLEQLEDRNDEDYSEYLEVLEETNADPILGETLSETDPEPSITQVNLVNESQVDIESYAKRIQSKYRKIRPKRMKTDSLDVYNSGYSVLKSPTKPNSVSDSPINVPLFVTNVSTPTTPVKSSAEKEEDLEHVYLAPQGKSSIELFFDSMAQTVKKLPAKAQADIKMHICKIVTEAEVRYSGRSTPQSTQQFIAPPGMIPKLVLIPCNMIDEQNKS